MADFDVALESSEINVTLVLERTVGGEGGGGVTSWNDLEDKPTTFPPSTHNHDDLYFTESEVTSALAGKSDTSHVHDDRYFTESEVTSALAGKSDTSHVHDDRYFTESEVTALIAANTGHGNSPFIPAIGDSLLTTTWTGYGYGNSGISTTTLNSNNKGKLTPFYLAKEITVNALSLYAINPNAGASAVVRLGVFADNDGRPGDVVIDAGTASINATGLKTLTFTPVVLPPGRYWAAAVTQNLDTAGTNPTFACTSTAGQSIGDPAPAASNNMFANPSFSQSGALVASPTVTVSRGTNSACPHIFIRRSA